ncbi:MAG TPA: hypothetical protein VM287_16125 [Egibacteraceae bacterium]|nr:hypothetical protein [Egibacteraceae bacterium]
MADSSPRPGWRWRAESPTWRWGLLYVLQLALLGLVLAVLTPALAARTQTELTQTLVGAIALLVVAAGYTYIFFERRRRARPGATSRSRS